MGGILMFLLDRARPRVRRILPLLAALALFLAACGAGAALNGGGTTAKNPQPATGDGRAVVGAPNPPGGEAAQPSAAPGDGYDVAQLVDAERKIVKTGEVTIEVPKVSTALTAVRSLAERLGGYVGDSRAGSGDASATLTLRIPATRFADALAALHELDGTVLLESTREQDVTGAIVDLQARIDNLHAAEAQYRDLLGRAEKIQDILDVQSRLDQVRGEIEQLTGQLKSISGQADLSTLTVTLTPRAAPVQQASSNWDPGKVVAEALAALVELGQGVASVAIWFAIVWLPILLLLGIVALFVLRGLLELRRRMPVSRSEPPAAG
jgi:hypothetical protein